LKLVLGEFIGMQRIVFYDTLRIAQLLPFLPKVLPSLMMITSPLSAKMLSQLMMDVHQSNYRTTFSLQLDEKVDEDLQENHWSTLHSKTWTLTCSPTSFLPQCHCRCAKLEWVEKEWSEVPFEGPEPWNQMVSSGSWSDGKGAVYYKSV
jgi:hypothetical protein